MGSERRPITSGRMINPSICAPRERNLRIILHSLTPPPSTWRLATAKSAPCSISCHSCNKISGGCCKSPSITPNTWPLATCQPRITAVDSPFSASLRITLNWGYSKVKSWAIFQVPSGLLSSTTISSYSPGITLSSNWLKILTISGTLSPSL